VHKTLAQYLPHSRNNRRLTRQKARRLAKAAPFLLSLNTETVHRYHRDMTSLARDLARTLGTDPESKTVVFAVKTFGYAAREITGEYVPYPFDVPIPVDSRITKITRRITDEDPVTFWNRVAERTSVPPLHLDTVLWLSMSPDPEVVKRLKRTSEDIARIVEIVRGLLGHP